MLEMPIVAGAGGGVGASTVASALGALDAGLYRAGQPVQVLVCRLTMASIGDAQRAIAAAPAAPVLAVVADIPRAGLTDGMRARLRMSEPLVPATVMLPYVPGWRDLADPWTAAATWQQEPRVPRPLRAFVAAIGRLAAAVAPLLRPLAPPGPPAVAVLALAPAAVRSAHCVRGGDRGPPGQRSGCGRGHRRARGHRPGRSAAGRGGQAATPAPVRPGPPVPVRPVVRNPTRGR